MIRTSPLWLLFFLAIGGCAAPQDEAGGEESISQEQDLPWSETITETEIAEIEALTQEIHRAMLLDNEMPRFAEVGAEGYVVMIPGGIYEDKEQVIGGAVNFNLQTAEFSNIQTRVNANTAVVTGAWEVSGLLLDTDMSGRYQFLMVYERTADGYQIVAESVTRGRPLPEALSGGN